MVGLVIRIVYVNIFFEENRFRRFYDEFNNYFKEFFLKDFTISFTNIFVPLTQPCFILFLYL